VDRHDLSIVDIEAGVVLGALADIEERLDTIIEIDAHELVLEVELGGQRYRPLERVSVLRQNRRTLISKDAARPTDKNALFVEVTPPHHVRRRWHRQPDHRPI